MQNNSSKFTALDEIEMYNNAFKFFEEKLAQAIVKREKELNDSKNRYSYGYTPHTLNLLTKEINQIDSLYQKDFYIPSIKKIKEFILNSSIVFFEPKIASKNDLRIYLKYRLKFPKNNSGFAEIQKLIFTYVEYSYTNTPPKPPKIEEEYSQLFIRYEKLRNKENQYEYNYFDMLNKLINTTLCQDSEIIEKNKEFNDIISNKYKEKKSTKKDLVKGFFKHRLEKASSDMKQTLKDSTIISNVETNELVKLFQLMSKFPNEIIKIQNVIKSYDKDIIHMDENDIKNIFDEIKVLALFK